MNKFLQLSCIPRSADFGLLVLRLWLGLTLLIHHGVPKIMGFSAMAEHMPDPLHVGGHLNMILMIFAEVVCAAFVVVGFATRFAALVIAIELTVAFFCVHGAKLSGEHPGELAFIYVAGFVAILLAGGGRFVVCNQTNDVAGPTV